MYSTEHSQWLVGVDHITRIIGNLKNQNNRMATKETQGTMKIKAFTIVGWCTMTSARIRRVRGKAAIM